MVRRSCDVLECRDADEAVYIARQRGELLKEHKRYYLIDLFMAFSQQACAAECDSFSSIKAGPLQNFPPPPFDDEIHVGLPDSVDLGCRETSLVDPLFDDVPGTADKS